MKILFNVLFDYNLVINSYSNEVAEDVYSDGYIILPIGRIIIDQYLGHDLSEVPVAELLDAVDKITMILKDDINAYTQMVLSDIRYELAVLINK